MRFYTVICILVLSNSKFCFAEDKPSKEQAMQQILANAPIAQRKALIDRHVSEAEYKSAIQASYYCFVEGKENVIGQRDITIKMNPPDTGPTGLIEWSYTVGSFDTSELEAVLVKIEALDDTCRTTFASAISSWFILQQYPTGNSRAAMLDGLRNCVQQQGVILPDDFDTPMTHQLNETEYVAVANCADSYPLLFIAY